MTMDHRERARNICDPADEGPTRLSSAAGFPKCYLGRQVISCNHDEIVSIIMIRTQNSETRDAFPRTLNESLS